jgi:prepilin-type N-terminal cleavage/methylation domain-containing protein
MKSAIGSELRGRRGERGFSLLEVIIVVVLMCLVLAMTYPALRRGRTAFHLRAVGRDVMNALRVARETAVTEQKTMVVTIDHQDQKVVIADDVGDGARVYRPPADVMIAGLDPAGEEVVQGPFAVRFLANGSSEDGQFLVKSETGARLKIVLDPITGSARMLLNQTEKMP